MHSCELQICLSSTDPVSADRDVSVDEDEGDEVLGAAGGDGS